MLRMPLIAMDTKFSLTSMKTLGEEAVGEAIRRRWWWDTSKHLVMGGEE
jgi:hypothetical protein